MEFSNRVDRAVKFFEELGRKVELTRKGVPAGWKKHVDSEEL